MRRMIILCLSLFASSVFAYSGGSGTPEDPYQIATAQDLIDLGNEPNDYDKHFILTADIDLDPNLPGRKVFDRAVIAPDVNEAKFNFQGTAFSGSLNGDGHIIKNLRIEGIGYLGIFGTIAQDTVVTNLGIKQVSVTGSSDKIGALVGINHGRIEKCYSTGTINGDQVIGGLVGVNYGKVTQCYSTCVVRGNNVIGGLLGYDERSDNSEVSYCFSTGRVNGNQIVGGFVGHIWPWWMERNDDNIVNCFWNIQSSGLDRSFGGTGLTTEQMQNINTYLNAGWDFADETANGTENIWQMPDNGYPMLWWQKLSQVFTYSGGSGTDEDPYQIATAQDLIDLGNEPNDYDKHFVLTADIDLDPNLSGHGVFDSPVIAGINSNAPIEPFSGAFYGNGYSISGFNIDSQDSYVGFFGIIASEGKVTGLILTDAYVYSRFQPSRGLVWCGTGLIASKNNGTVIDCNVSGTLISQVQCGGAVGDNSGHIINTRADVVLIASDSRIVGGLVGYNDDNASISNSLAVGWIEGESSTGGFVGHNRGDILNSYCSVNVFGSYHTGGLTGENFGMIVDCNTTGEVTATGYTGGLVGYNAGGQISNSFSSVLVKGTSTVGGLIGINVEQGTVSSSFSSGPVHGESRVGGLVGDNDTGSIHNCYSSSIVNGSEYVGGFAGLNYDLIENSYSTGDVNGVRVVGGLVGSNIKLIRSISGEIIHSAVITNCYSTGTIIGTGSMLGGLVGHNHDAAVNSSYWDIETSKIHSSDGGTGLSTSQMQSISTFLDAGWDFVDEIANGTEDIWRMPDNDYPMFWWQKPSQAFTYSGGSGSAENPYQIATAQDLIDLGNEPNDYDKHFILTADIDLSGYVFDQAVIALGIVLDSGWGPYRTEGESFSGSFDGQGNVVRNLHMQGSSILGLFGLVENDAEIFDLGVEDVNITGSGVLIGGLVGDNTDGMITSCYCSGSVNGDDNVGGLVGRNTGNIISSYSNVFVNGDLNVGGLVGKNNGKITSSYNSGSIIGDWSVGGLVGDSDRASTITSSYNRGSVNGLRDIGGLVGANEGNVTSSYSYGSVSGNYVVGGLVGDNHYGIITSCYSSGLVSGITDIGGLLGYNQPGLTVPFAAVFTSFWDKQTSGTTHSDGGTGLMTVQMKNINTYLDTGWDFVDETANGTEDIWWMPNNDYPMLWWQEP